MLDRTDEGALPVVRVGPYTVELRVGDVAESAGRIPVVSSDDNYLSHGGGVSAAIWQAVGAELRGDQTYQGVVRRDIRPELAQTVVTHVSSPPVPVLHAITIDLDLSQRLGPGDLGLLYTNLLATADSQGIRELVLPCIGAGVARISVSTSVTALLDVVRGRSLLPRGQRLALVLRPGSSEEAGRAVEGWMAKTGLEGAPTSGSPLGSGNRAHAGDQAPGHWESRVRQLGLGPEPLSAARDLDRSENTSAGGPALQLWQALVGAEGFAEPTADGAVLALARSASSRIARGVDEPGALLDLLRGVDLLLAPQEARPPERTPVVGSVRADWSADGTQHVRNLHDLLRTTLSDGQVAAESRRLEELGYRGQPFDRILENCATDHPVDVLQRHFSGQRLRGMLVERGVAAAPSTPPRELARRLLHQLGFPIRDEPIDPDVVLGEVEILFSELHGLSEAQLTGRIAGVSRSIEAILRTYLRFLTAGMLGTSPDVWLQARREKHPKERLPPTVDKATLGQLAILVRAAGSQVSKSTDPVTRARVRDLLASSPNGAPRASQAITWLPEDVSRLVGHRNTWVHGDSDDARARISVTEKRRQAREFCELAEVILRGLATGPFPSVVVIEEVAFDRWGRRHVRARTSKGTLESIFTDQELTPGQTYLMYANTNPLRVDPLLVRQAAPHDAVD